MVCQEALTVEAGLSVWSGEVQKMGAKKNELEPGREAISGTWPRESEKDGEGYIEKKQVT